MPSPVTRAAHSPSIVNDLKITEIKIYDNYGALKKANKMFESKEVDFDINGLKPGSYFIEIIGHYNFKEKQVLIVLFFDNDYLFLLLT